MAPAPFELRLGDATDPALVEELTLRTRALAGPLGLPLDAVRSALVGFHARLAYASAGEPFFEVGIEHRRMARALGSAG